jgi:cell division protein FtsA
MFFRKMRSEVQRGPAGSARFDEVCLGLDIGTEFVKAVAVKATPDGPQVVASIRQRQEYGDMEGGAICNIDGVTCTTAKALDELRQMCGRQFREAVVGIAGLFVKGIVTRVDEERSNPGRPLSGDEFRRLVQKAQATALKEAKARIAEEMRLPDIQVELVNSAVVETKIDGHKVTSPFGFQGKYVNITIFNTFAPLIHIGALRTVGRNVGLNFAATVAEPYAVAVAALTDEASEFGAVVLDVGGGTTDAALIQRGGVAATASVAMGGRAFTRCLAASRGITLREAEDLKLDYSEGRLDESAATEVQNVLQSDVEIWKTGVGLLFDELTRSMGPGQGPLPVRLALCGGGSALPGLHQAVIEQAARRLGAVNPEVGVLVAEDVRGPADPDRILTGSRDVTPKGLALIGARIILAYEEQVAGNVIGERR